LLSSAASKSSSVLHTLKPRFLEGLTPSEFKLVVEAADYRRFPANYVVTNQDHPAKHLYLLLTGRARYFFLSKTGQRVILLWIPPGEIVGPAALLVPPTGYHVSAETITDSSVLVWDRATIQSLAARYPKLIENVLPLMLHYLTAYRAAHIALLCGTARERLAHVLVNLANGIGHEVRGGVELTIRNEELANEANITLFTTSRLLNQWQRAGLLVKSYGKILLRSPERLLRHEQ
jgi:CRP-like cAMP-binding protein